MKHTLSVIITGMSLFFFTQALACGGDNNGWQFSCPKKGESCCGDMGGIDYCDSSAGFYVCKNGDYSACYCTRHAIMDLQKISGCCTWHGGVSSVDLYGRTMCRDGTLSPICTLQLPSQNPARW